MRAPVSGRKTMAVPEAITGCRPRGRLSVDSAHLLLPLVIRGWPVVPVGLLRLVIREWPVVQVDLLPLVIRE